LAIAQMAELVDALGSGPSGGNTVEVRVLFWAPPVFLGNHRISPQLPVRPMKSLHFTGRFITK
jgi:hypothetical protein